MHSEAIFPTPSRYLQMSALGLKQTFAVQDVMSASPQKADMCSATIDVRFGPAKLAVPRLLASSTARLRAASLSGSTLLLGCQKLRHSKVKQTRPLASGRRHSALLTKQTCLLHRICSRLANFAFIPIAPHSRTRETGLSVVDRISLDRARRERHCFGDWRSTAVR